MRLEACRRPPLQLGAGCGEAATHVTEREINGAETDALT